MVDLATGRYQGFEPSMGVPVATTVGMPRFRLRYEIKHRIRRLAPWGLLKLDGDEFVAAYRARLDDLDIDSLVERFEAISAAEDGRTLILLCFEDVWAGQLCHRRIAASWLEEKLGIVVPEIPAKTFTGDSGQLSLAVDEPEGSDRRKGA